MHGVRVFSRRKHTTRCFEVLRRFEFIALKTTRLRLVIELHVASAVRKNKRIPGCVVVQDGTMSLVVGTAH